MIDYKKIFKNGKTRYKILDILNFIPDKYMIKMQYRIKTGRALNLKDPKRYTEKIQAYKLYYRDPKVSLCSDKSTVRDYVIKKGLGHLLNESFGVFDKVEDINWDKLPNQFVLKDSLGGGGRSMLFVYDKNKIDKEKYKDIMNNWINTPKNKKSYGREWVYNGRKHRILAERLLTKDETVDLPDYKFFCFDGQVFCSYMMKNYTHNHEDGELGFFDRDFNLLEAHRLDFKRMVHQPKKPKNYDVMVEAAEILSEGFPHVRVDFYNINGKIIFGEMTFFNASGYTIFQPDSFDFELGSQFNLNVNN